MGRPAGTATLEARDRLLRAAEKLFAEKGFAATTVHEITDAAGVNRALLYYYFEDKHSLYSAVIDKGIAQFIQLLNATLAGEGSYSERLAAFVHGYLELTWNQPDMCRVMDRCHLDGHQEEFRLMEKFAAGMAQLEGFFRDGMAAGEFREVNPAIAARSFIGPMFMLTRWRMAEGERFSRETLAQEVAAQLLEGFRARD